MKTKKEIEKWFEEEKARAKRTWIDQKRDEDKQVLIVESSSRDFEMKLAVSLVAITGILLMLAVIL